MTYSILLTNALYIIMQMITHLLIFIEKLEVLHQILVKESLTLIQWFKNSLIKANLDKCQTICVGKRTFDAI